MDVGDSRLVGSSGSVFNARNAWVKTVAERVNSYFFHPNSGSTRRDSSARPNDGDDPSSHTRNVSTAKGNVNPNISVRGIILGGSGPLKNDLERSQFLLAPVRDALIRKVDVSYGGQLGFHETIAKCSSAIGLVKVENDDAILANLMEKLENDIDSVALGVKMVIRALSCQLAKQVVLSCDASSDLVNEFIIVVKRREDDVMVGFRLEKNEVSAERRWNALTRNGFGRRYAATDIRLEAHRLRDFFKTLCEENNAELELIGVHSPSSVQLAVGFGGCMALLYAPIDITQWDDWDDLYDGTEVDFADGADSDDGKDEVDDLLGDLEDIDDERPSTSSQPCVEEMVASSNYPRVVFRPPQKEHVTLVLAGHVDSGKSTISGQILLQLGAISDHDIRRYKAEAKARNRSSWWISFCTDEDEEEREKGKTVECGRASFETDVKRYTIMDAPGHASYVPNMINGATVADVAILVISARQGEFEAGFERGGQTKEHAQLIRTLGIRQLVVVVNKMDCVDWSVDRYMEIVDRVKPFLKKLGFKKKHTHFVPASGQHGTNIRNPIEEELCDWYDRLPLLATLDDLKPIDRALEGSLRVTISCRAESDDGSVDVLGKIECGVVHAGDTVVCSPGNMRCVVDRVCVDHEPVEMAGAGENVMLTVSGLSELEIRNLRGGVVMCPPHDVVPAVRRFEAQVFVLNTPESVRGVVSGGFVGMCHVHNESVFCRVSRVVSKADGKSCVALFKKETGTVIMEFPEDQVAVEAYSDCSALGRFTIRSGGATVLIGKVVKILP